MLGTGGSPINSGSIVTARSLRMNLSKSLRTASRLFHSLFLQCRSYPRAKFILLDGTAGKAELRSGGELDIPKGADVANLHGEDVNTWRALCEHLRLAPPGASYPVVREIGQRQYRRITVESLTTRPAKRLRHDRSPWVVEPSAAWVGISASGLEWPESSPASRVHFEDDLSDIHLSRWMLRNDTF